MLENKMKSLLIIIFLILLISCNLIISNPHTRENPNDPEAEISKFYAFALDTDKVITTWQWKDDNYNSDESIEEIRILHSKNDYPQVLLPFAGESFTNSSISQFEWTGLDKNTTHYFALHMKDERNRWYAPLFAKATLPGGAFVTGPASIITAWRVDSMMTTISNPPGFPVWMNQEQIIVMQLDLPSNSFIISAKINPLDLFGIRTDNGSFLSVYSLEQAFNEFDATMAVEELFNQGSDMYLVDESSLCEIPGQNNLWNSEPLDIANAVQNAVLSGSNQIMIKMMNSTDVTFLELEYADFLEIEYITK